MNQELKEAKQAIRAFWPNYSDERLAWLLAHARGGNLSFFSCCCFIGVATADHALRGANDIYNRSPHLATARTLPAGNAAEEGFFILGKAGRSVVSHHDEISRRRIIPMIKAEMRRRERQRLFRGAETIATVQV